MKKDWQEIFNEFALSGTTAKAFCKEREIKPTTFYYWKKKLSKGEQNAKGFLEIDVRTVSKSNIEIQYPNGVKLRVLGTVSKTELRGLIYV